MDAAAGDATDAATNAITVRAPGKLILMGEHAVVYERPALVTALGLWLDATIRPHTAKGVHLNLNALNHQETTSWAEVRAYSDAVRERWEAYAANPTAVAYARMRGEDPAHLAKVALGEAARRLPDPQPVQVSVRSEQPIGAGFGSSAAVGVAVAQACLAAHGVTLGADALYDVALAIERRQHGLPSGVDPATVLRGGVVWAERNGRGLAWHAVEANREALAPFRIFDTGTPREATGTVVDAVRHRRAEAPAAFEALLDRMSDRTRTLRQVLAATDAPPNPDTLRYLIHDFEACLEAMGVVPAPVQALIRSIENKGGAAKISGAGALTGSSAGSLLVYHPDPEAAMWDVLHDLPEINVPLGVAGAHERPLHDESYG
ncbi:MAG: hypothetical protein GVY12_10900 [Bacteroidetes bacterium]|jgi:mevalonate kinase|nr:hypothetical protein [Bacteroidota bacterium]